MYYEESWAMLRCILRDSNQLTLLSNHRGHSIRHMIRQLPIYKIVITINESSMGGFK